MTYDYNTHLVICRNLKRPTLLSGSIISWLIFGVRLTAVSLRLSYVDPGRMLFEVHSKYRILYVND